jgi:uncharacterized membrane protein (UPF0127 family)
MTSRIGLIPLLVACLAYGMMGCEPSEPSPPGKKPAPQPIRTQAKLPQIDVRIANKMFALEVAVTDLQHEIGMMGRTSMGDNEGMLFLFDRESFREFWMGNCLIALDIIYLDRSGKVVGVRTLRPPAAGTSDSDVSKFPSLKGDVQYVIELKGGRAHQIGLSPGQTVSLPLPALKNFVQDADDA